jgi:hypothetical protein
MLADDLADTVTPWPSSRSWGMFNVQAMRALIAAAEYRARLLFQNCAWWPATALDSTPSRLIVQDILQVMDGRNCSRNLYEGHRLVMARRAR